MSNWLKAALFGLGAVIVLFLANWANYAELNRGRNTAATRLSDITVFEQRRGELVAQLLPVVQASVNVDQKMIDTIAKANADMGSVKITASSSVDDIKKYVDAGNALTGAMSRLIALVQNYPDLKSQANILTFLKQLEGSENRLAVVRLDYNEAVRKYNTCVTGFFCSYTAQRNGFAELPLYQAPESSRAVPNTTIKTQ